MPYNYLYVARYMYMLRVWPVIFMSVEKSLPVSRRFAYLFLERQAKDSKVLLY